MGLGTHGGGYKFVNISNGKMHVKIGDEMKDFDYCEGSLREIGIEQDIFEGQAVPKVCLMIEDEKAERLRVKFTLEGWYSIGFFSRIGKIDLSKPFRLGVFGSEKNEKISFCYMKQAGQKIESDKSTPKPEDTMVGKKTIKDWTKPNQYAESAMAAIMTKLNPVRLPEDDIPSPKSDDLPF